MTLRLITLGSPSVLVGDKELPSLPGKPVTFGLLVYLAVEREATRDRLVSVFWPESSQDKARHTLSQTLYELRQVLGEDWVTSAGNGLRTTDFLWVDCLEFREFVKAERHAEAVELYGGPFLGGVHLAQTHPFEEWVERTRARLGRGHRAALDSSIEDSRARGDMEAALKSAWKWVEMDPLDDGGQQHLIQLLAESGSRSQALAQYDRFEGLLRAELGLDPLDETVGLVETIRSGAFQPSGADLGEGGTGTPTSSRLSPSTEAGGADYALSHAKGRDELMRLVESELMPSLEPLRPIGKGSTAEIFLAREPGLKRLVAVKVLSPKLNSDPRARKRFEREAQAAARLHHPHICTVHRVGSFSDGTPYLVSPFIKGTSLAQRLKAEGRMSHQEVRRVLREMASALAAAHRLGIIHRDVRPGNVLREEDSGRHLLCDFGIAGVLDTAEQAEAKLTRTGEILGQPAYISPEQMHGRPLTDRADVYSLGVLGHQLVTGDLPPFTHESRLNPGGKPTFLQEEPLSKCLGDTDPDLADLIGRCLAEEPSHRPSASDVQRKLAGDLPAPGIRETDESDNQDLVRSLFNRRLPQILGTYIVAAWLALEVITHFAERGDVPEWAYPLTLLTIPFGFFAVTILGWFHGERGRQQVSVGEKWLLWATGVGWIVAAVWVLAFL